VAACWASLALSPTYAFCIIGVFSGVITMEAERINAIASSLADLNVRAAELRRYL